MAITIQSSGLSHRAQAPTPSIKRCLDRTVQAADRLDDWIRRYVVDHPLRYRLTVFSSDQGKKSAARQRPLPPFSHVSAPQSGTRSGINPPPRRDTVSVRDKRVWLLAIGDTLKAQYDAGATALPHRLAVLVQQLETRGRPSMG
jgi:hypothetical protein